MLVIERVRFRGVSLYSQRHVTSLPLIATLKLNLRICYIWLHMLYLVTYVIFGYICYIWLHMLYLVTCVIFGYICYIWLHMLYLVSYVIFGYICYIWLHM